jgi:hypothetical protein
MVTSASKVGRRAAQWVFCMGDSGTTFLQHRSSNFSFACPIALVTSMAKYTIVTFGLNRCSMQLARACGSRAYHHGSRSGITQSNDTSISTSTKAK